MSNVNSEGQLRRSSWYTREYFSTNMIAIDVTIIAAKRPYDPCSTGTAAVTPTPLLPGLRDIVRAWDSDIRQAG